MEGFWINGVNVGVGVFRTPAKEYYEGLWHQDKSTGLCVFRRSEPQSSGDGIEVWSDGSYYFGDFVDGMKQGSGVYYWTDGSRYDG